jgi:hypothetical protein
MGREAKVRMERKKEKGTYKDDRIKSRNERKSKILLPKKDPGNPE